MFNFFLTSTEIDVTSFINQILFYFRKIPLLKHLAPGSSYKMRKIKKFFTFISPLVALFIRFGKTIFGFLIAFFVFLGLSYNEIFNTSPETLFLNIMIPFMVLDISNFYIRDKKSKLMIYHEVFDIDPKISAISNMIIREAIDIFGEFLALLIVFLIIKLPAGLAFRIVVIRYFMNLFYNLINIKLFEKKILKVESEVSHALLTTLILFVLIVLIFVFDINVQQILMSNLVLIGSLALGIVSLIYLLKYNKYTQIINKFAENYTQESNKSQRQKNLDKTTELKKEDLEKSKQHISSKLSGYALLNEIFFQRHRRILLKPMLIKGGVLLLFVAVLSIFPYLPFQQLDALRENYSELVEVLPGLLPFACYFVFQQDNITRTMFVNCDQSLMQYGFYTRPKDLLKMFGLRLKKLLKWNGFSLGIFIAYFLILRFFYSATNYEIIILIIQSIALWVFFSVHTLFVYYIFQPFNEDHEAKSPIFHLLNIGVYYICYFSMNNVSTSPLVAPIFIGASLIYNIVALVLVYNLAPKTFKVRTKR